jgi:hypothetical protein
VLGVAVRAQPPASEQIRNLQIPKINKPPRLEEFLNGNSRADMKYVDDFRQRQPGDGVPSSRKTSAWLGYDDKNIYAVFVCESPPHETRARLSKREDIFSDDVVGLLLDTYQDRQHAYEFFVNPLGVQADATETEGQNDDFSFDTLWYSDGKLTPTGFAALIAVPFRSIRFTSEEAQTWGLALYRNIRTNNEDDFWPYVTQRVSGFTQQLGTMDGLENISPGHNLQLIPYFAFGHSHFLDQPENGDPSFRTKTDPRAGLDAKAVIHDSLTLDVTLNPDFAQVESDDPQVTVNQRFEVRFPEKRPFFLENAGYFTSPETLFFSRRIVDPEFGARLTGKLGRWNLGFLGIDDRAAGSDLAEDDPAHNDRAVIGVARVQREFGTQSNVGFFLTDREFAGSYNRVGALDTRLKLSNNWTVNAQAMASQTRDLDGNKSGGNGYFFNLHEQDRKYLYDLTYTDLSEGFHTDLGFVPRVNIRQLEQFARIQFHPKSKVLLSYGPRLYLRGNFDHSNVQQDWNVNPGFNLEFTRATYFGFGYSEDFERFNNINFRKRGWGWGGHTEYFKRAIFDWNYNRGIRVNYDPAENLSAFRGDGVDANMQMTIRPTSRLKIEEIYYYTHLATRNDSFAGWATAPVSRPTTVFVNHLLRSRTTYQFTRELSLRFIVDYDATLQNPELINQDRQKRVTGDILLTYLLHPGTALYIGYTDQLENLALDPNAPPTVYRIPTISTTTSRQFFAKISYLFRF